MDSDQITLYREALCHTSDQELWRALTKLGCALYSRFTVAGGLADLEESVSLLTKAVGLQLSTHSDRVNTLFDAATVSFTRYVQLRRLPDLVDPIAYLREALKLVSNTHVLKPVILGLLSQVLQSRYEWGPYSKDADIIEAFTCLRQAVVMCPTPDRTRQLSLGQLGQALYRQYRVKDSNIDKSVALSSLDESASLLQEALELAQSQGTPKEQAELRIHLSLALRARFLWTAIQSDLDKAISMQEEALSLCSDTDRPWIMTNLVTTLHIRYDCTKQPRDLIRAIDLHNKTLTLPPQSRRDRSNAFTILEPVLRKRLQPEKSLSILLQSDSPSFELPSLGSLNDTVADLHVADSRLAELRSALKADTVDRVNALSSLGLAHYTCAVLQMEVGKYPQQNIDESITLLRNALDLYPSSHPERPSALLNLSLALYVLYESQSLAPDMDSTLEWITNLLREALDLQSDRTALRASIVDNLALSLHARFKHGGKPLDLDEAVLLNREALDIRMHLHLDLATSLLHLAETLQSRAEESREIFDLEEAIKLYKQIFALQDVSLRVRKQSNHQLASTLQLRFALTKRIEDLDEAVLTCQNALALCSEADIWWSRIVNNLAVGLRTRFTVSHHLQDLDSALNLHRAALNFLSGCDWHPDVLGVSTHLASTLSLRAEVIGRLSDLNEAIKLCSDTLLLYRHNHNRDNPVGCSMLNILGRALIARFLRADDAGDNRDDCSQASDAYDAIQQSIALPLSQRYLAVRLSARISDALDDGHGMGLQRYLETIELLPHLASIGLNLVARQRALVLDTDGLACEAAACAIRQKKYDKAVEFLETGRAIFWSQALQLRTPVHQLEAVRPDLAQKLREVSNSLERGALGDVPATADAPVKITMEREKKTVYYRQLEEDREELLERIRQIDSFRDFLMPKTFEVLSQSARHGPVVILNASSFRSECDALVLTPGNNAPLHIPLRACSYQLAQQLRRQMQRLCGTSLLAIRGNERYSVPAGGSTARGSDDAFRKMLGTLWKFVVLPVLDAMGVKRSDTPSRIWWLPTGPFSSLPIHAAGNYQGPEESLNCTGNYVVSSYIPTLNSLLDSSPQLSTEPFQMLAVIQSNASGHPPLPYTKEELECIRRHIPGGLLQVYGIPDRPADVQTVLAKLPAASINPYSPLKSSLIMKEPLEITELMQLQVPYASLVYLSACQTAMGDDKLPDEVINLAVAFLFVGYRSAVATLWSIHDRDGPKVADVFYEYLSRKVEDVPESVPQVTQAAYALHAAVKKLRNDGCSFARWVPFIHMGL
ncbi:CHAT domain-containing protein [Mycena pura]|uniref:CHAT domain-containing protein n=1 Tax=Mycena pura TaxID=153505 RepID=A0AAD7E3S5_9AGAR|nr:CHAT domain-containing protein [Mycena pura]